MGSIKDNRGYIISLLVISILIFILVFWQLGVIFKKTPNSDNYDINYQDSNLNINNTLSILKDITMENHPLYSNNNIKVKNKITNYLDKIGLRYVVQEDIVKRNTFEEEYQETYETVKETLLNNPESNPNHYEDLDEFLKWEGYFDSFEDYYIQIKNMADDTNYQSLDEIRLAYYQKYDNNEVSINNIIIPIGEIDNNKNSIVVSAHYDSGFEEGNNGASDNGMNVAALLECARLIKNKEFNNNIYLVVVNGEESNLVGSNELVNSNILKNVKLILNFDNHGTGGNLFPWRYTNSYLVSKYIKAVSKPHGYVVNSKMKELLADWADTDYSNYSKKYEVLDLGLFMDNENYHTSNDSFENINVKSLDNTTKTMYELIMYFGNDTTKNDNDIWFMEIFNGLVLKLDLKLYQFIIIVLIAFSIVYLWYLLYQKRTLSLIINAILIIISVILYFTFDSFVLMPLIPILLSVIGLFIKQNTIKKIYGIVSYSLVLYIYAFAATQFMSMITVGLAIIIVPILYLVDLLYYDYKRNI